MCRQLLTIAPHVHFFTEAGLCMVFMVAFRQKLVRPQPVGAGAARCVDSAFRPTGSAL